MSYLYRFEIKGIQNFVFATNKMKEIAGGSALIDSLFQPQEWGLTNDEILAQAAGAATLEFATKERLQTFAQDFPMYVQYRAPGIEFVHAWIQLGDKNRHQQSIQQLLDKLKEKRNDKMPQIPELGPLVLRSGRTGSGVTRRDNPSGNDTFFDSGAYERSIIGETHRSQFNDKLLSKDSTYTFSDGTELEEGYVAVIHIDGNDIGQRVRKCQSTQQYKNFSNALTKATENAAKDAIAATIIEMEAEIKKDRKLLIRPIVLGGDDFTVVVKAKYALTLTKAYIEAFEKYTNKEAQKLFGPMNASAGIAYVKAKSPFYANYHLCEQLCSYSKNAIRERLQRNNEGYTPSSITFHRVTTSALPDLSDIQSNQLVSSYNFGDGHKTLLSSGPYLLQNHDELKGFYSLEDLNDLCENFADKKIPKGSFREWLRQAQSDQVRAQKFWNRIEEVHVKNDSFSKIKKMICESSSKGPFTERRSGNPHNKKIEYTCPILDVITLGHL